MKHLPISHCLVADYIKLGATSTHVGSFLVYPPLTKIQIPLWITPAGGGGVLNFSFEVLKKS